MKIRDIDGVGDDLVVETFWSELLLTNKVDSRGAVLLLDVFALVQTKLTLMKTWNSLSC